MAHKSLIKAITRGSTGLIVCAFLIAMAVEYWHAYTYSERAHQDRLEQELTLLSQSLENLLWALDDHAIGLVGDAYMAGTDSVSFKVVSSHTYEPVYAREKASAAKVTYGQRLILHDGQVIGQIEIGLTSEAHDNDLARFMKYSLILALVIIASLALVMRRLINRQLATPLAVLGAWTQRVASGDYDAEPPPIELVELDSLAEQFRDMSEKIKVRERELVTYRDQLQLLVDEQTEKLKAAHEELLQRERLATLGELTATVSHELRNPLGTIQTSLFAMDALLADHESPPVRRSMELAERNISRCVNIIEELNSYARVKKLQRSVASVDDWLQGVVEELEFPDKIDVELRLASGTRMAFDQEKLRQVIVNLVNNAVDALLAEASTGTRLEIASRRVGESCEISIRDNGCGMSEDVRRKIFEPLFSTKGFGVGLGMVVVKNVVDQHHGQVRIESTEGEGTRVTLSFPTSLEID